MIARAKELIMIDYDTLCKMMTTAIAVVDRERVKEERQVAVIPYARKHQFNKRQVLQEIFAGKRTFHVVE